MAWGTASCPKVDKVLGPGNQYVTAAKMLLQNSEAMIAIDMPAGPSEVLVMADAGANPAHVASDLLSQVRVGVMVDAAVQPPCHSPASCPLGRTRPRQPGGARRSAGGGPLCRPEGGGEAVRCAPPQ